jgi:hypothetical protein
MQLNIELEQYRKPCTCADWTYGAVSFVVFQHNPECPEFDRDAELMIMADKLWQIHLEKFEASLNAAKGEIK